MNRITSRRALAALGLATALAAAAGIQFSSAQTAPRPLPNLQNQQQDSQYGRGDGGQYGGQSDLRGGRGTANPDRRGVQNPEDRLERRLAFLHTRLRITPAQERAWTALTAVLQDEVRDRPRERQGQDRGFQGRNDGPSVVQRLEERQRVMADRSAELDRVIRAVQPLYASFNEDQRRTADRLMFRPGRERGFGGGERGQPRGERGENRGDNGGPNGRYDDRQDRDYR